MNKYNVRLIAIEGVDEVGKSTAIKYLVNKLQAHNPLVTNIWQDAGIMGEEAYKLINTGTCSNELVYHMAMAGRLIALPKLSLHKGIIIVDRWAASTFAYNGYYDTTSPEPLSWLYISAETPHVDINRPRTQMDLQNEKTLKRKHLMSKFDSYLDGKSNLYKINNNGTLEDFHKKLDAYANHIQRYLTIQ